MPQEHLEKLRQMHINRIKHAYIFNCSCEQWIKECKEDLKNLEESYTEEEKKTNNHYKLEREMYEKMSTKEYYDKACNRYIKDLEILQDPKSTRKKLFGVFSRHNSSFDKDLENGSYGMSDVGWVDNYRVSGYPCVTHHNAKEAIEWLEEYDNGNNICCDMKWGMCDEIKTLITDFFNQFPNGTIHYG